MKLVDTVNTISGKSDDYIAWFEARFFCRAVRIHRYNQDSVFVRQIVITGDLSPNRNILSGHADVTSTNAPVANESAGNKLGPIDRDRKPKSLRRLYHRRIYADNLSAGIYERAARVSRVERRVGLNDIVDQAARSRSQASTQGRYHSRGNGRLKTERV